MKRIVFVTDNELGKNINGVVTWITNIKNKLEARGHGVYVVHPGEFRSVPLPMYPEIRISIFAERRMEAILRRYAPDCIHIATEGPLGLAARRVCVKNKWRFTTFYHTRLPEYVQVRLGAGKRVTYAYLRWFHNASAYTMLSTPSMRDELASRGFKHIAIIPPGIDLSNFKKNPRVKVPAGLKKPIFTYLGRLAAEKNIEAFLECDLPGSKLIIGDGPARKELQKKYGRAARFAGYQKGKDMIDLLSVSDVFVFPSKTDTFGLAIVEALACGVPVAAYNVAGPKDIITNGKDGYLGDNLEECAKKCLKLGGAACVKKALRYSWDTTVKTFLRYAVTAK